jgi:hypothetical protein
LDDMTVARVPGNLQGTILLFLSLNLILLVFFVLLNVMSTPTTKKAAHADLSVAPSTAPQHGNGGEMDERPEVWQGWLQASIVQAVNGKMVVSSQDLMADADSLWVTFPMGMFFDGDGTAVKSTAVGVLQNLAALAGLPDQNALRLEIGLRADPERMPLAGSRAVEVGNIVFPAVKGRAPDAVVVASQPLTMTDGDQPVVVFTFRSHGRSTNVERAESNLKAIGGKTEWLQEKGAQ